MFISGESAQLIVDEIKTTIHQDLNIMDGNGEIIASTNRRRIGTLHRGAQMLLKTGLDVLVISEDCEADGTKKGINLPIHIDGECVGVIGITGEPKDVSDFGSVIQKMTEIMIDGLRHQEALNLQENARFNFIECWLFSENIEINDFELQASLLHIDLSVPRIIAVLENVPQAGFPILPQGQGFSNVQIVNFLRSTTSYNPQNLCVSVNRRVIILFAESSITAVRQHIRKICSDMSSFYGMDTYCGISSPALHFMRVQECYKEAVNACRAACSFGGNRIAVYDEKSLYYITQNIPRKLMEGLESAVFEKCSEEEKAEILQTLALYFKHEGNITAAAEEAYMHPNSYLYRLNKVARKTKLNPRKPKDIGVLSLVLLFHQLNHMPE
jgi:carbohydrate diacid regulator